MKLLAALPLLGLTSAFVIPDQALVEQINRLPIAHAGENPSNSFNAIKDSLTTELEHGYDAAHSVFDNVLDKVYAAGQAAKAVPNPWTGDWSNVKEDVYDLISFDHPPGPPPFDGPGGPDDGPGRGPPPPHHGPPHDGPGGPDDGPGGPPPHHPGEPHGPPPPHHGPPPHGPPPHHGKPPHHRDPHHGHEKPNLTVYQLIQESKYTTKFAELINEHEDIVGLLNSTENKFNLTVFAPTDDAFDHIPEHHGKPDADTVRRVILYHIVKDEYPAGRVLGSDTIPTALDELELGGAGGRPQRLRISLGFRGVTINFYSHLNAANIPATNGVIHGVTAILVPPPPAIEVLSIMPSSFSTLELALIKTGLDKELADLPHKGLTLFAPDNRAWARLPRVVNAFLFSEKGLKYLKYLLQYHVVVNETLYSDAYYPHIDEAKSKDDEHRRPPHHDRRPIHLDLETLLEGKSLSIDVANFYGFRNIRINGYNDVHVRDGVAKDGVLHIPGSIIVPPKKAGDDEAMGMGVGEDETVEEFISRFEGLGEGQEKKQKQKSWWEDFEL